MNRGGLIAWFAANPVAANLLMVLVIVLGVLHVGSLRKEAFPSMEPDSLSISVTYDSGSAKRSEEGLAIKIEEQLEGVAGIKSITSTSTQNGVNVLVEKTSGYDLDVLLRDVKNRVDSIFTFPADAEKPVISKAEREEHSIWIQLYGNASHATLQQLADALKMDLLATDSISRVSISGRLDPIISIEINEAKLQEYALTFSDIESRVKAYSSTPLTAVLSSKTSQLQLQVSNQAYRKNEFEAIPIISTQTGREVLLGDIATVRDTFNDESPVLSRFNGSDAIAIEVLTTGEDDITDSVETAREVVERWRDGNRLGEGVSIETWYDRSSSIMQRLSLLVKNAITGIVLVFILLALFLNLSVAFWVAMGLPFIFFGTFYFMGEGYMGLSLNEFTTFGFILALGIVVDDAVVVGESVYEVRSKEGDSVANTIKGTLLVAMPTIFGVLTTVAAFYALSNIEGHLGMLYSQFAAVVAVALILSIIESKLILPAHLAHLNTHRKRSSFVLFRLWQSIQGGANRGFVNFNQYIYQHVIVYALRFRYAVALGFLALFIVVMAMPFNGAVRLSFFPEVPAETVRAEVSMLTDATYGQTHAALAQLERSAYEADEQLRKSNVSAIEHMQILSSSANSGKLALEFSADSAYTPNEFVRLWKRLAGVPEGVRTLSMQSSRHMVSALRVELRADDDAILIAAGQKLKAALQNIPAISGIEDNLDPAQPQLQLRLNEQGRAMGLTTDLLATQMLQAFKGQVVQRFERNSDEIEVRVRYPEAKRQNPLDVLNARIRTPDGNVVALSSVATFENGYTRDTISRIDGKRAVYLASDLDKEQLSATELVMRLKNGIITELERDYPGLDIHFAGEAEEQAETESSMAEMFMVALLIIYMLLAIPLKSYMQPLLIMTAIPFGVVGAILGHWMNDLALGILSFNGIIALSGVVVNDSLLLVARFNEIKQQAHSVGEAIIEACSSRLRAVLLTSFTTFAGLMPLLGETSHQAQFLIPAAVSLAYGIMFATVITLILIPSLLMIQIDVSIYLKRLVSKIVWRKNRVVTP